jgi:hypothetical protein
MVSGVAFRGLCSGFEVSRLVSGFRFWGSDFVVWGFGFLFRVSSRVSGFLLRFRGSVKGFRLRVYGFGLWFRVTVIAFGFRVSGFGFQVSGIIRVSSILGSGYLDGYPRRVGPACERVDQKVPHLPGLDGRARLL